jgi:hypothetical protein
LAISAFKRAQHPGQTAAVRKANLTEARSSYAKDIETWRRIKHPIHAIPGSSLNVGDPILVAKKLRPPAKSLTVHTFKEILRDFDCRTIGKFHNINVSRGTTKLAYATNRTMLSRPKVGRRI